MYDVSSPANRVFSPGLKADYLSPMTSVIHEGNRGGRKKVLNSWRGRPQPEVRVTALLGQVEVAEFNFRGRGLKSRSI